MKKVLSFLGSAVRELFWVAVAIAVIFGGYLGFQYLGANREVVEVKPIERPVTLVETQALRSLATPLPIRGEGFIKPFREVSLSSQTGGRIIELHSAITNEGTFLEGDVLARLNDSSQRASLVQTEANIAATQARLDLNETQLSRTQSLRDSGVASQQALDQILSSKAELEASLNSLKAAKQSAEVALSNTVVLAPFDGAVLSKSAEVGTVVGGGQMIAEIFTQDRMEVDVPVREADAALIPGLFNGQEAPATVRVRFAGQEFDWDARVTRVASALDRRTRTLNVTVELNDVSLVKAAGSDELASGAPPALINAFAKVIIEGLEPENTYPIPSTALRGGNQLWMFDPVDQESVENKGVLRMISANLIHVDGETSYVQIEDQPKGARLIKTAISTPSEGMPLQNVAVNQEAALEVDRTGQTAQVKAD